jgi:tripartite-type tricarboxylate transporter receptor subunit TctC
MNRRNALKFTPAALAAVVFGAGLASSMPMAAIAQTWPSQTVKIVVPYVPGGTTDIAARVLAPELSKIWGQQVVVDNRAGAATQIGTDLVAKSRDKHTILLTAAPYVMNPSLFAKLPYDTAKDFMPVTLVVRSGLFLVANPNSPFKTVADVVKGGKDAKGVSMANSGNGSMGHMSAELLADMQKINVTNIPYRGSGQALTDLVGGQVPLMFDNPSSSLPFIRDNKLIPLAYSDRKRSKALPNVPTMAEAGIAGFETVNWFGLFAPSDMGDAIADKIQADVAFVLRKREIIERFSKEGVEVGGISRESFNAFLAVEQMRWNRIIKSRNIKPD